MIMHSDITDDRLIEAAQSDGNVGFCVHCGNEQGGCEPDARQRECEACRSLAVYGAEELMIMRF